MCSMLMFIAWLCNTFHSSLGGNLIRVIKCENQLVRFRYDPPLPAASTNRTLIGNVEDSGTWIRCQVLGINVNVKYYLSITTKKANCERATFSKLIFRGNFDVIASLPKYLFNFTIVLSDPIQPRQLNTPQAFQGKLTVPSDVTIPSSLNITFTFPEAKHASRTCQRVTSEQVLVDAYLYVIDLPIHQKQPTDSDYIYVHFTYFHFMHQLYSILFSH